MDTRALATIDNVSVGVKVYPLSIDNGPQKSYKAQPINGRSGDLLINNERYTNVERSYTVLIEDNFDTLYAALRAALYTPNGYCRLEDSWNTNEFYQAYFSGVLNPTMDANRTAGKVRVTFTRKPQRWLKTGDTYVQATLKQNTTDTIRITNSSAYPIRPLLYVARSGGNYPAEGYAYGVINSTSLAYKIRYSEYTPYSKLYLDFETREVFSSITPPKHNAIVIVEKNSDNSIIDMPSIPAGTYTDICFYDASGNALNVDTNNSYIKMRWYTV